MPSLFARPSSVRRSSPPVGLAGSMTSLLANSLKLGTRRAWREGRVWGSKMFPQRGTAKVLSDTSVLAASRATPFEGFADLCAETEQETLAVSRLLLEATAGLATPLPEVVRHIVASGGKRLRSRLLIASAKLLGARGQEGVRQEEILQEETLKETIFLGGAVEAIHCASLLHDDVVDGSKMRRGLPAAHRVWGAQASVLVGDFLFASAFELICRQSPREILTLLSQTALRLTQGEVRQLYSAHALLMTADDSLEIVRDKTGALFRAATMSAALVMRASPQEQRALALFGERFGIGYQLVDDMLDYLGESKMLGKRRGDDLRDGKVTYPLVLCLARSDARQRRRIEQLLARSDCADGQVDEVARLMRKTGCFDDCAALAKKTLEEGAAALEGIGDARLRGVLQRTCLASLSRLS